MVKIIKMHFYQAKSTLTSQFYIISHAEFDFHGFDPHFIEKTRKIKILKNPKNPSAYLKLRPAMGKLCLETFKNRLRGALATFVSTELDEASW